MDDFNAILERASKADEQAHPYVQLYETSSNTTSWLGGLPSMPNNMNWPIGDGNPYRFIAQINCSDLPAEIWSGLGPRDGWLLIFGGYDSGSMDYKVLHSKEFGVIKDPPSIPKEFYGHHSFVSPKVSVSFKQAIKVGRTFEDEEGVLAVIGGRRDKFHPGIEISDPRNALLFEATPNSKLDWIWHGGFLTITTPKTSLSKDKFEPIIFDMGG